MAERKVGRTYSIGKNFYDYSYIINGVAGVGKTTMAMELGEIATGSNEGTFIITCGREPDPSHIIDAFGDIAPDFKRFREINQELCENKAAYPDTKFVCWDSLDELFRIGETYVVAEYNKALKDEWLATPPNQRKDPKYAKSIAQSYGGFGRGETRVANLVINEYGKLIDAGYKVILLGHTKEKSRVDLLTGVSYNMIGCNLENKYYNALKDKVNLVCTAYFDHALENVKEVYDPFSKKNKKVGNATSEIRMAIFLDDDMAVDTKSHLADIEPKIEFNSKAFVKAVQDAIAIKIAKANKKESDVTEEETPTTSVSEPTEPVSEPEPTVEEEPETSEELFDEPEIVDDVDDTLSKEDKLEAVKSACKGNADLRAKALKIIKDNGLKTINADIPDAVLDEIYSLI